MRTKMMIGITGTCLLAWLFWPSSFQLPGEIPIPAPITSNDAVSTISGGFVVAQDDDIGGLSSRIDVSTDEPQQQAAIAYTPRTKTLKSPQIVTINDKQYPLRTYRTLMTPNDPLAGQWWEANTKLPAAWDIPRGGNATTLAIIDTGFALKHEEFSGRWAVNPSESGTTTLESPSSLNCTSRGLALEASCNLVDDNMDTIVDNEVGSIGYQNPSRLNCTDQSLSLSKTCNRIDDDNNGYVDDVTGWDFINYDNSVQAGEINPSGTGTKHGTLVAGVAAATGNNAKGIAGVDWGTKILPLQALDDDSYGDTRSVGRAIFYAVERDVDVISISLGSDAPDDFILEAVRAALAKGITVVASSGNDGCDCMVYPARYPEVLAVGALNTSSQAASFSSWGQNIDVLAPGTQITSPTWTNSNGVSAYASGINGTSFSAPMVGGMLTRLLSQQPDASPQQLTAALTENANRLSLTVPHDTRLGFGTLDAQKASLRMQNPVSPSQLYALSPIQKGSYLTPGTDIEKNGGYNVHTCETGSSPSTAIYELKKTGGHFFTISKAEQQKAVAMGYTSALFTYGCLQQPHDTPNVVRSLNIFQEFLNVPSPR